MVQDNTQSNNEKPTFEVNAQNAINEAYKQWAVLKAKAPDYPETGRVNALDAILNEEELAKQSELAAAAAGLVKGAMAATLEATKNAAKDAANMDAAKDAVKDVAKGLRGITESEEASHKPAHSSQVKQTRNGGNQGRT